MFFVDEIEKKVYGHWLDQLEIEYICKKNGKTIKYPLIEGKIIYYPLDKMKTLFYLSEKDCINLSKYSTRKYNYNSFEPPEFYVKEPIEEEVYI